MPDATDDARVLHVDDDTDLAAVTSRHLELESDRLSVVTVDAPETALERIRTEQFDCVVSDYQMPGMDGLALLEAVRAEYPDLPFVLYTGKGSEEVASDAIAAGVTDYLQKGTGLDHYAVLANRVENAIAAARAEDRAARQERISGLVRGINRRLVEADSVRAVDRTVCEAFAESDSYRFAWIGEPDPETGEIRPRTSAGDAETYLDEVTVPYVEDADPAEQGPAGRAVQTGELRHAATVPADQTCEEWRAIAERHGFESVVFVPLSATDGRHDVLGVYADTVHATGETEREVLAELGDTVSRARAAAETRSRLECRESELATRTRAIEAAPVGVTIADATEPGEPIVYANDRFCELTGYDESSVRGRDWRFLDGPATDPETSEHVRTAVETCEPVSVRIRQHCADGDVFWSRFDAAPVRDDDGRHTHWVGFHRDVSEVVERERTLEGLHGATRELVDAESKTEVARLTVDAVRDTLDYPNNVVRLLDGDANELRPVAISAGAETILGERPSYPVGEGTAGRAFADGETLVLDNVQTVEDGYDRKDARASMYVPIGDHGTLSIGDTKAGVFDESDVHLAEIFAANAEAALDRVEQAQTRKRQNERLEAFTSVVSHDLRNPLSVLVGSLPLAEETGEADHFERCYRALDRMERLIDDLLRLAREGETVDAPAPVSLPDVARDAWATVDTGGAELRVETDATVLADESRLRQLVENLVRNSVEHGPRNPDARDRYGALQHGDETVTVTVGDLPEESGFFVADDGSGIPDDRRDRVFESGFSTSPDGTGFGLAIVSEIASAHGWTTAVTESDTAGARVEIRDVDRPD
ncbi:GAF domain-containing protein [Halosimplex salinum]|uniref:GAF domain-containing protein n=1 Tax=Halosimplex salinum TaxID=1710538 RepID=UPI000F49CCA9|nr:GAF domain-containing protein [Halosimplex salinum]